MLRVILMDFMKSDSVLRMYQTGALCVPSEAGIALGLKTLFIQNHLVMNMHAVMELVRPGI
jgi:hypothetical protein